MTLIYEIGITIAAIVASVAASLWIAVLQARARDRVERARRRVSR